MIKREQLEQYNDGSPSGLFSFRIIGMTIPDMSSFLHYLPEPTFYNNGGFRFPPDIAAYSPIDLATALYSEQPNSKKYKKLKDFFNTNDSNIRMLLSSAEFNVYMQIATIDSDNSITKITSHNISEWKYFIKNCEHGDKVEEILKANAPFTSMY